MAEAYVFGASKRGPFETSGGKMFGMEAMMKIKLPLLSLRLDENCFTGIFIADRLS